MSHWYKYIPIAVCQVTFCLLLCPVTCATFLVNTFNYCERFKPRNHFIISRWSIIVWVTIVLNRTIVDSCYWRFNNLCASHLQRQSELFHISWWLLTWLAKVVICQLRCYVIYWLWRHLNVIGTFWSIYLSLLNSHLLLVKLLFIPSFCQCQIFLSPSVSHLHCVGNFWLSVSGVFAKLVNQLSIVICWR